MTTLTRQQIFDAALFGVRSQGYVRSGERIQGDGFQCQYNGPDGRHCAVGWPLANAGIDVSAVNYRGVRGLLEESPAAADLIGPASENQITFLRDLQRIHDSGLMVSAQAWESGMLVFASKYGLTYTEMGDQG